MKNGYVIQVGHYAAQKVIVATPDKETAQPTGNIIEAWAGVGVHQLINRARVWGRRVLDNGGLPKDVKGEEITCEVTNKEYHGKIEFLKWGDYKLGAQALDTRYLPQSQSLDVHYQDEVQKIRLDYEGKDGSAFIELGSGEQKFDYKTQALLIQFLQIHPQNKDSKSKNSNPNIKGYQFFEITEDISDNSVVKQAEAELVSGNFVMNLSTKPSQLKNLLELFISKNVDFGDTNLLSTDLQIYTTLLKFAKDTPGDFGFFINEYKKDLSDCFEKAKSYKALDLTKNGFVAMIVDNKADIIFEVEGKGDAMLDNVMSNFLDDVIYERTKHLKTVCEKLN